MDNIRKGIIFIRNPKCATMSIRAAVERHCLKVKIDELDYHQTALEWKNKLPDFDDYFKFTIIRNPFDRLLSGYMFICRRKLEKHKGILAKYGDDFEQFVTNLGDDFGMKLTEVDMVTWPQKHWIVDENDKVLINEIGRYENLIGFWYGLCAHLGWKEIPLGRKNQTRHRAWPSYYTPKMRKIVYSQYRSDFEMFGYNDR